MYRAGASPSPVLLVALGGHVAGLDPATGKILWKNDLSGGGYGAVDLASDGEVVYASAAGNRVFAIEVASGKTLWNGQTTAHGRATIVIEGERIFVAKGGFVDAYSRSGELIWNQGLPGLGTGRAALGFPGNLRQADEVGSQ
jgi:outer membrane protein assembly factor BamB